MSPELQAKYIIHKMQLYQVSSAREVSEKGQVNRARHCALVCVDLILDNIDSSEMGYWREVKKIIVDSI